MWCRSANLRRVTFSEFGRSLPIFFNMIQLDQRIWHGKNCLIGRRGWGLSSIVKVYTDVQLDWVYFKAIRYINGYHFHFKSIYMGRPIYSLSGCHPIYTMCPGISFSGSNLRITVWSLSSSSRKTLCYKCWRFKTGSRKLIKPLLNRLVPTNRIVLNRLIQLKL